MRVNYYIRFMRATRKVSELSLSKGISEIKETPEEKFEESKFKNDMDFEDFLKIKNSKSGYICIEKTSKNSGYLSKNQKREGFTPMFSENFSCYIYLDDPFEDYYYTSTIEYIDWEKKEFRTRNSTYSFLFKEMSPEEYDKTIL